MNGIFRFALKHAHRGRRKGSGVADELTHSKDLLLGERVLKARHARQPDAVFDFPEGFGVEGAEWMARIERRCFSGPEELRRVGIHAGCDCALRLVRQPVADGAILPIKARTAYEVGLGGRRNLRFGFFPGQGCTHCKLCKETLKR